MSREQIIEHFANDPEYKSICKQVAYPYHDDLFQEIILILMKLPDEKLSKIYSTCPKCFFYRVSNNQFRSNNSEFYRTYFKDERVTRKHAEEILQVWDSGTNLEMLESVEDIVGDLDWTHFSILTLYAETQSIHKVAEATNLGATTIHTLLNEARESVKILLKKKLDEI